MASIHVEAERHINAPAERVYSYLADYRMHHPAILPPAFTEFAVEEGGVGAGTVIRFKVKTGGRTMEFRQVVSEPEPGRVLTETSIDSSGATTFTVTPEGSGCRVRIVTEGRGQQGIAGVIERYLAPLILRRLYKDELNRLDRYATERAG